MISLNVLNGLANVVNGLANVANGLAKRSEWFS